MWEFKHGRVIAESIYLFLVVLILLVVPLSVWKASAVEQDGNERVVYVVAQNPPGRGNAYWSVHDGRGDFSPRENNIIRVRNGEKVVLRITSIDNAHRFSLPVFGVEEVIYPGRMMEISFVADVVGEFGFSCNLVCGDEDHSKMKGRLVVEPS